VRECTPYKRWFDILLVWHTTQLILALIPISSGEINFHSTQLQLMLNETSWYPQLHYFDEGFDKVEIYFSLFCLHLFAALVCVLMAFLFHYGHWELVGIEIECFNFAPKVDMNPWKNSPPFKHPFDEQSVTCQVTTGFGNCKLPYPWTCCSHGRIGNQCHLVQRAPFRL